jgi:hypothetical protein
VDAHGGQHSAPMLALFERYLDGPAAAGADEATYDRVREGLVVLLGTLARHLPPQDPKARLQSKTAAWQPTKSASAGTHNTLCCFFRCRTVVFPGSSRHGALT